MGRRTLYGITAVGALSGPTAALFVSQPRPLFWAPFAVMLLLAALALAVAATARSDATHADAVAGLGGALVLSALAARILAVEFLLPRRGVISGVIGGFGGGGDRTRPLAGRGFPLPFPANAFDRFYTHLELWLALLLPCLATACVVLAWSSRRRAQQGSSSS
jgi:hypothetical protein